MSNPIFQLISILLAVCGWVTVNFLVIIYVSVKRLGGKLEKRHTAVLCSVASIFFLSAIAISVLSSIV